MTTLSQKRNKLLSGLEIEKAKDEILSWLQTDPQEAVELIMNAYLTDSVDNINELVDCAFDVSAEFPSYSKINQ
jgi:hypothetical protein